jgi:hypothetical protein
MDRPKTHDRPLRRARPWARKLAIVGASILVALVAAELLLRAALFSDARRFAHLRDANLYADNMSDDDYWKLNYLFGGKFQPPEQVHPVLGWVGRFARDTYVHHDADKVGDRRPVLLYGDSFAQCVPEVECFEDFLDADPEFSREHCFLNYGVGGYGVGQILLLLQHSIDHYENPFVVISLMTEDLDRSILRVRSGPKPRFRVEDGRLVLDPLPVLPKTKDHYDQSPPEVPSYVLRWLTYSDVLPYRVRNRLRRARDRIEEKKLVNEMLIDALIAEVVKRKLDFCFLVFHPNASLLAAYDGRTIWRDEFLKRLLDDRGVPYIWSEDLVPRPETRNFSRYILLDNGHPTTEFNRLIAARIGAAVSADELRLQSTFAGFERPVEELSIPASGTAIPAPLFGRFADGTVRRLLVGVAYSSDDPAVVGIAETGRPTSAGPGRAVLTARYAAREAHIEVVVGSAPRVEPDSVAPWVPVAAGVGGSTPVLTANGFEEPLGTPAELRIEQAPGGAPGALFVAFVTDGAALPRDAPGLLKLVAKRQARVLAVPIRADGARGVAGAGNVRLPVPASTLERMQGALYLMAVFPDAAARPGWCASNGVVVTLR